MVTPDPFDPRRILLTTAPLADPILPNLAIEQLAAIARHAGTACDVLYATLLLPSSVPRTIVHGIAGPAIFAPAYFGIDASEIAFEVAREIVAQADNYEQNTQEAIESVTVDYLMGIDSARICLEKCLEAIPAGAYDVIAFSVGFDAQKLPSAAIGRLLKQREPRLRILWGGTACDGDMGEAILEMFPEVDAVAQGEAEASFLPAVSALRGEQPFAGVPACLYRDGDRVARGGGEASLASLDNVPDADYTAYIEQRGRSPYVRQNLVLLFESSRGCWWGRKHHCLFCGIRSVDFPYRRRSADQVVNRVLALQRAHSPYLLYATDAILDLEHLKTVLPELAARRRVGTDLRLFYEIKSNLRREQVAVLAAAGVREVQPGIESFSSNVLRLMKKGATGLQQVELIKWAQAYDITLVYGIIAGTPGETLDDYLGMLDLFPLLHHLPPPLRVNRLGYHKFSPYAVDPAQYGITDVRPFNIQRLVYRAGDDLLRRLCYELEYTAPRQETPELLEARRRLAVAVFEWQREYVAGVRMVISSARDRLVVVRRGPYGEVRTWYLTGAEADVYRACERVTSVEVAARAGGAAGRDAIDRLRREKLLAVADGKCLALAIPSTADAWEDAGLGRNVAVSRDSSGAGWIPLAVTG